MVQYNLQMKQFYYDRNDQDDGGDDQHEYDRM